MIRMKPNMPSSLQGTSQLHCTARKFAEALQEFHGIANTPYKLRDSYPLYQTPPSFQTSHYMSFIMDSRGSIKYKIPFGLHYRNDLINFSGLPLSLLHRVQPKSFVLRFKDHTFSGSMTI